MFLEGSFISLSFCSRTVQGWLQGHTEFLPKKKNLQELLCVRKFPKQTAKKEKVEKKSESFP
jgi:hypothetical protein